MLCKGFEKEDGYEVIEYNVLEKLSIQEYLDVVRKDSKKIREYSENGLAKMPKKIS